MKFNRNILCLLFLIIGTVNVNGQEIKVNDFYVVSDDKTAEQYPRLDNGDNPCALVKIKTNNIEGLSFINHNQYIGAVTYKDGVYYVYVPFITRRLSFAHDNYQPGTIEFGDYGYNKGLKSGKTYEAILEAPNITTGLSGVSFKISPFIKGCKIILDGNVNELTSDGVVKIDCPSGSHRYVIKADNYIQETGHVEVGNNYVPINISLRPATVMVDVLTNPSSVNVLIDNVSYGKAGRIALPMGHHELRLVAKGYIDYVTNVNITPSTALPQYQLQKNKGRTIDIHAVPVKIYCDSRHLYKNNKIIEEWSNGSKVMFMPGSSCRLSDDYGKGEVFRVGDSPMTIKLSDGDITVLSYDSAEFNYIKQ